MLGTRFHPSGRHLTDEFRKQVARVQLVFKPSSDNEKSDDVLLRHGKIYLLVSLNQRTRNRRASWAERGTQSLRNTCNPCSCFRTNCTFRSVDAHETPHNSQGNDSPQAVLPVFTHPISVSVSAADLPPIEVAQLGNIACPSVRVWRKTRYP